MRKTTKAALLTTAPEVDFSGVVTEAPTSLLDNIAALVDNMREQKRTVEHLTAELEAASGVLNRMSMVDIPEAMELVGLTEVKLTGGAVLKVKDDLNAYINETNRAAGFAWLREKGLGSIIKEDLVIDMRVVNEESKQLLLKMLGYEEIETTVKESIHAATLKSAVKDMLAKGLTLPPSISVHQFKKAELKEPKK